MIYLHREPAIRVAHNFPGFSYLIVGPRRLRLRKEHWLNTEQENIVCIRIDILSTHIVI